MDSNYEPGLYQYQKIDLSTDAIRLLRLRKGSREERIQCELLETFLHRVDGLSYEALSYAWGDAWFRHEIFINDQKAFIGENLYLALLALRHLDEDRLLWVDAICINQKNDKEKGHQVGQMRLIYECAEQVVVWLGPSNPEIDSLMDLARRWDYQTRQAPGARRTQSWIDSWINITSHETGPLKEILTAERRKALQEMLTRSWFRRVWILQEVASASRATLLCGSKAVSSQCFSLLPTVLELKISSHTQAVLDIFPCYRRKETWWGEKQNLETLLLKFGTSEATDHRDNIYALLGIASDARTSNILRPNYEISLHRTIANTILFLLFQDTYHQNDCRLPEDLNFATFLRTLPKLPDHVLGWALLTHNNVLAAAVVPKAVDINNLYDIRGVTLVPPRSPLSWIISSRANYDATLRAILERDDANVAVGESALVLAAERDRLDLFKLLLRHSSAHSSALSMGSSGILLSFAQASRDIEVLERTMSIVTSRILSEMEVTTDTGSDSTLVEGEETWEPGQLLNQGIELLHKMDPCFYPPGLTAKAFQERLKSKNLVCSKHRMKNVKALAFNGRRYGKK